MAVTGNLQDMSLVSIISINCNERNRARLLVRDGEREAVVFFEDGQIVHAGLDSQKGEDVIYELLSWQEGEFELDQGVAAPMHTVTAGWSAMLLGGLSRIDESRAGLEVEWDEIRAEGTKETQNGIADRMARALERIAGIEGALVCSREGELLSQDDGVDAIRETALSAFVGRRTEALGAFLKAGLLKQVVLVGAERRMMLVTHEHTYVGLSLAQRTSVETMIPVIHMTLRRYR